MNVPTPTEVIFSSPCYIYIKNIDRGRTVNVELEANIFMSRERTKNVQGVALALERELYVVQRGYTPR